MATIKEVAKAAGVSVTTVSRVINNRGYINKDTRQKVEAAMASLDYHPNEIARALQRSQSDLIGIIVPDSSHPFFAELIHYVETYANELQYKILICNSLGHSEKEANYISMLRQNRVDGIIMCGHSLNLEQYKKVSLPIISFDRIITPSIPYVGADNFRGGELATEHLVSRGCRKLLHISGPLKIDLLPNRRTDAFRLVCMRHDIPHRVIEGEPYKLTFEYYWDFVEREVSKHLSEYDGVFCSNDILAYALYIYATQHGISVPEQLKIVGYDYHNFTRMLQRPKLTTIRQPIDRIGKALISNLIQLIDGNKDLSNTVVDVELIEGETS
ncbi:LacI family DNA-binding transcriptional regulator [Paenibacillus ginsengihumi]|uniref:LacI family DNA-binding transcriptional regulator n=1 Tax=Paenibacillus ginsengihumi TaxID=431596 RepID=UPI00036C3648|nr:LacI family DNA-binding transcriptional regulator [Paenibacillus ginsengihumi]